MFDWVLNTLQFSIYKLNTEKIRHTRLEVFYKRAGSKSFTKLTGKDRNGVLHIVKLQV